MNWLLVLLGIGLASLAGALYVAVRKSPVQPVKPLPLRRVQCPPHWDMPNSRSNKYAGWPAPKSDDENHGDC